MNFAKSLWALVQGDPIFMRRINGWLTVLWIGMIPVSYLMGWLSSVVYVSALSLWALVSGHWAAWQAARVEVTQDEQMREERRYPLEERVAERVVRTLELHGPVGGPTQSATLLNGAGQRAAATLAQAVPMGVTTNGASTWLETESE